MRKLFAVLALSALVAACGDDLVQPAAPDIEIPAPSLAKIKYDGPGAWVGHWSAAEGWCILWDSEGNLNVPADCVIHNTPSANGAWGWVMRASGIPNNTGKTIRYGPDLWPQSLLDVYMAWLGFDPRTADGLMPFCDWNYRLYSPDFPWEGLTCTLNWHYTLSKTGVGTLTTSFTGEKTWHPFPDGR